MFDVNAHLMPLKGKSYLQVMWRLVWFREDHPDWNIETELIMHESEKSAVFVCKIFDAEGKQKASGHGSESVKDFHDYLEKAETKAIGRALAMLGYGTQFAPELDEGERIVDSPVELSKPTCEVCGAVLSGYSAAGVQVTPQKQAKVMKAQFGKCLCVDCARKAKEAKSNG